MEAAPHISGSDAVFHLIVVNAGEANQMQPKRATHLAIGFERNALCY